MSKSLNFLVILLAINFILVAGEDCTETLVKDPSGKCIEKEACTGYVTGTSCATECDDAEYAVTVTSNKGTYKNCISCTKDHVSSD